MQLLILDDDVGMANFIAGAAIRREWSVDTASTEDEFRSRFGACRPDAIVLDLQLGTTDGIQQLKFLAQQNYSGVVALMSGFDSRVLDAAKQLGTSLGLRVTVTLEKPARLAAIDEALDSLIRADARTVQRQPEPAPSDISTQQIDGAIARGELCLYLQPIVTARRYAVSRLEALLRWAHPTRGMVPPLSFISVAERDEALTDRLTFWVIEAALDHYQQLRQDGLSLPIAVNVSGVNLRSPEFPDRVASAISARGLPMDVINLEVTETVIMRDATQASEILSRLRLKGIDIAIDDLGTGYSGLSTLRQMPFSEMKIDASFVRDVMTSRESRAIVKSLVDLSQSMAIASVAEGVESDEVAQELMDMGVDYLQGYYFSRPLPIDELRPWLRTRTIQFAGFAPPTTV